ncbi:MAG: MGMT family protein, partial [Ignavibacteria bacterium]|nr:MGMT family protein [Ignavibacteria bacterium]
TINEIRKILAKKYQTTIACPITTGIFAWISANAAEEEIKLGKKKIIPYWRTLKSNGEINDKYPGGVKKQIKLLEEEGFEIIRKGKKFFVKDYEKYLVKV